MNGAYPRGSCRCGTEPSGSARITLSNPPHPGLKVSVYGASLQVSELKEALQEEAMPGHDPGPSMTLSEAVEHFLSLLFAAEPGSSGHVLGSHGKLCSRAVMILLQAVRALQSSSSAGEVRKARQPMM